MDNRKIDVILINFKDEIDDLAPTEEFMATLDKYRKKLVKLFAIPVVSQRSELLAFAKEMQNIGFNEMDDAEKVVDIYLKANCG
jgi:hypothetical protein